MAEFRRSLRQACCSVQGRVDQALKRSGSFTLHFSLELCVFVYCFCEFNLIKSLAYF